MEGWLSCTAAVPGKGRRGTQLGPLLGSPSSWRQTEFKQGQLFLQPAPLLLPSPLSSLLPLCSGGLIFTFSFFFPPSHLPVLLSGKLQTGSDSSLSRLLVFVGEKKSSTLSFFPRSWREQICERKKFLPSPEEGKGAT